MFRAAGQAKFSPEKCYSLLLKFWIFFNMKLKKSKEVAHCLDLNIEELWTHLDLNASTKHIYIDMCFKIGSGTTSTLYG